MGRRRGPLARALLTRASPAAAHNDRPAGKQAPRGDTNMPRPIWTGTISFGLLNIPIRLMTAERRVDLHFRMLDSRDQSPIRYERVNAETGEEVPWKDVVKAFEYDKGNYVVMEKEDFKKAAPDSAESVDIEAFVDPAEIGPEYYEKPYYLVPTKKAEKGYVLLRETLKRAGLAGLARVVIRTREYLSLVLPRGDALVLILLRFPQELVPADEYDFPEKSSDAYRINDKELEMAKSLVESMASKWAPKEYRDEFRLRLQKVIEARVHSKGGKVKVEEEEEAAADTATNVVDFMSLLKKSIDSNKRTPAKGESTPKKVPAKKRGSGSKGKKTAAK
jgi:DNA end-binding protein Ku